MRTLRGRMVLVGVVGALVVAGVALVLALPFVRSVARDEAREQLVRSVETLAARPQVASRLLAQEEAVAGPDDRTFSVVTAQDEVVGPASAALGDADLARLRRTGRLSLERTIDGTEVLVEARTSRRSLAVVGLQPVSGVDAVDRAFVRRLVIALLVGLLVSAGLAVVVARRLVRPVAQTAHAAHRLASGERGVDVPTTSVAELDDVTSALGNLDAALAASEGRQREFLLSVSHEIRTPLTAVRGYAEALRDGAVRPDDLAEVGAVLVEQTERLDRFVADLLALARLEADDFTCAREPVEVAPLLEALALAWRPVADRAGVSLVPQPAGATLLGDPQRVRQLLDGLVENALRSTPAGGQVVVASRQEGDHVVVEVSDDGPGLAPGEHERAFERGFLRDRHAQDRRVGTGLGLSIAHRLAQHMGAVLVASPGPDGGTRFTLRLPRA